MLNATVRVHLALAVAFCIAAASVSTLAPAQIVRGTVKSKAIGATLDRAQIIAQNAEGKDVGKTTTDANGRFYLPLKTLGKPFSLTVKRLGIIPTTSDPMTYQASDTIDVELEVEEMGTPPLDTFKVVTRELMNERSLKDAERRGWKVFTPVSVAQHRERARTFPELLSALGAPGIIMPSNELGCFRSIRTNKCLTIILDGRAMGTSMPIPPSEIYFVAIVSQNDAIMQWGQSHAPNGAIAIYTRMYGDTYKK